MNATRLCYVTDPHLIPVEAWNDWITHLVKGGVDMVQLRHKTASTRSFIGIARSVKARLEKVSQVTGREIPLIINDRVDVALACHADGVHLGNEDMPYIDARQLLGAEAMIGLSVESLEDVHRANAYHDLSYLGVSSVFATTTKENVKQVWGLEGLRHVRRLTSHRLMAIGGLYTGNVSHVMQAGADAVAIVSALSKGSHPRDAAKEMRRLIDMSLL